LLEGLTAYHEAKWFKNAAQAYGNEVREESRGHPLNRGDALEAVHPVIRVNPVTGWKGLFVNKEFTKRILGVTKDESDVLLDYLNVSRSIAFFGSPLMTENRQGESRPASPFQVDDQQCAWHRRHRNLGQPKHLPQCESTAHRLGGTANRL
jgi:hypothetical protein